MRTPAFPYQVPGYPHQLQVQLFASPAPGATALMAMGADWIIASTPGHHPAPARVAPLTPSCIWCRWHQMQQRPVPGARRWPGVVPTG